MKYCCVCGAKIAVEEPLVFFHAKGTNKEMYGCSTCEKQMSILEESQDSSLVKKAVNHFYTYIDEVENQEVKEFLDDIVTNNADVVEELAEKAERKRSVSVRQKDYFSERENMGNTSSGWTAGLRIAAWSMFIVIIFAGLIYGVQSFRYSVGTGFVIIISSAIAAFLCVAGLMVFLELADNIRDIRNQISKKK